jgi:branched-chain amino acid transport system ATP-binding protein
MVEVESLTVSFGGIRPVDDVSVRFEAPVNGLVGPNGAGKTTLFNVLSGFVTPAHGSVHAFDENLLAMSPHRRARWGLRRTFQQVQVIDDLRVWENVSVTLDPLPHARRERTRLVGEALDYVGLSPLSDALAAHLSALERRLVELARALVARPRVVLLDEPGAGLSEAETERLAALIRNIPDHFGALVVLVDHDMDLVAKTCSTLAVLDFGRLLASGTTREVLADERVKLAYLGTEEVEEA